MSPHVTFIVKEESDIGLQAAVGRTRVLEPHEIGTPEHARQVCRTVTAMTQDMDVSRASVQLVLIKYPLPISAKLETTRAAGKEPVTTDT